MFHTSESTLELHYYGIPGGSKAGSRTSGQADVSVYTRGGCPCVMTVDSMLTY